MQRRVECGAAYATSCTLSPQGGRLMPPILLAPEARCAPAPAPARPAPPAHHPHHSSHHSHRLHTARARATTQSSPNPVRPPPSHRVPAGTGMRRFDDSTSSTAYFVLRMRASRAGWSGGMVGWVPHPCRAPAARPLSARARARHATPPHHVPVILQCRVEKYYPAAAPSHTHPTLLPCSPPLHMGAVV